MKPILAFVAAFLVATGASTGVKVMTAKPEHGAKADSTKEGVDSTATDSSGQKSEKSEKAAKGEAAKDSSHSEVKAIPAASIGKVPGFAASSTLVENGPKPIVKSLPAKQAAVLAQPADSGVQASEQRLAKVFTAMEPKQAAKVLQHMQDADVQIILGYVGPRQAASIMAELPPERVATLSKMAMTTKGTK
jgi:flagellar motility protein MotE (MotC chaperone)